MQSQRPKETHAIRRPLVETEYGDYIAAKGKRITFTIGVLLCCTGIGAFIGLPLIYVALTKKNAQLLPKDAEVLEGPCPYCGVMLHAPSHVTAGTCLDCKKRFLVRYDYFVLVD